MVDQARDYTVEDIARLDREVDAIYAAITRHDHSADYETYFAKVRERNAVYMLVAAYASANESMPTLDSIIATQRDVYRYALEAL